MTSTEILELIVLGAIAIELYALYHHNKMDNRIDEHILDANESFAKANEIMTRVDEHMIRFDEHITRINEYMKGIDEHMIRFDEHLAYTNTHLNNFHNMMTKLDDHIHSLLNEYLKEYAYRHRIRDSI
ncbi:MAG: hypothetical protein JSV76_05500 [Candidatus Bathyarchaeota archaeon]|nr:MAG: hypothetical protein JSV76_05500 [Candidatus Bathyarchaeota archaeon]